MIFPVECKWRMFFIHFNYKNKLYVIIIQFFIFQGRHTKTGQLAAIKVMDVTEVSNFY